MTALPAANWYLTRRHYSDNLTSEGPSRSGRSGTAVCNGNTEVFDQDAFDDWARQYPHLSRKKVADLPECKACVKALTKRGERP